MERFVFECRQRKKKMKRQTSEKPRKTWKRAVVVVWVSCAFAGTLSNVIYATSSAIPKIQSRVCVSCGCAKSAYRIHFFVGHSTTESALPQNSFACDPHFFFRLTFLVVSNMNEWPNDEMGSRKDERIVLIKPAPAKRKCNVAKLLKPANRKLQANCFCQAKRNTKLN